MRAAREQTDAPVAVVGRQDQVCDPLQIDHEPLRFDLGEAEENRRWAAPRTNARLTDGHAQGKFNHRLETAIEFPESLER